MRIEEDSVRFQRRSYPVLNVLFSRRSDVELERQFTFKHQVRPRPAYRLLRPLADTVDV